MNWQSARQIQFGPTGVVLCEPQWSWSPRSSDMGDFDLWYVWAGRGMMRTPTKEFPLFPGRMFCLRPGGSYDATHDSARRLGVCYLHFELHDARGKVLKLKPTDMPPFGAVMSDVEHFERLLRRAVGLAQSDSKLAHAEATSLLQSALLAMTRAQSESEPTTKPGEQVIREVARHILENPGKLWTLAELATRAGYGVDHFSRLFHAVYSVSPNEFCIRARIERARLLLRSSSMTVSQIAEALGYSDVYFFSRQFRQRTQMTPTQWRAG